MCVVSRSESHISYSILSLEDAIFDVVISDGLAEVYAFLIKSPQQLQKITFVAHPRSLIS